VVNYEKELIELKKLNKIYDELIDQVSKDNSLYFRSLHEAAIIIIKEQIKVKLNLLSQCIDTFPRPLLSGLYCQ